MSANSRWDLIQDLKGSAPERVVYFLHDKLLVVS